MGAAVAQPPDSGEYRPHEEIGVLDVGTYVEQERVEVEVAQCGRVGPVGVVFEFVAEIDFLALVDVETGEVVAGPAADRARVVVIFVAAVCALLAASVAVVGEGPAFGTVVAACGDGAPCIVERNGVRSLFGRFRRFGGQFQGLGVGIADPEDLIHGVGRVLRGVVPFVTREASGIVVCEAAGRSPSFRVRIAAVSDCLLAAVDAHYPVGRCRFDGVVRALLRDGDLDLRRAARDDDCRRARRSRRVGFEGDFQRVAACRIAAVGRNRNPGGRFGAGLGDRRGPCPFGGEGHAPCALRVVGGDRLFQLARVRNLDLPEIARVILVVAA